MEILLTVASVVIGLTLGLPFLAYGFAQLNLFWTIVEEGQAKIIVFNGEFHKCVMRYKGFHLEKNKVIKGNPEKEFWGGLEWVGIWPFFQVYNYDFRWQVLRRGLDKETGKSTKTILPRKERLDYVFVKADTYFTKLEKAETKGMIPVTDEISLVIRVINPQKALFRTHQWFDFTVDMILPHIRQFQSEETFEDLNKLAQLKSGKLYTSLEDAKPTKKQLDKVRADLEAEGYKPEEIEKELKERKFGIIGILRHMYGIDVMGVKIEALDPSDDQYAEALAKGKLAELEATRIKLINDEIAKHKGQAVVIRSLEALEKMGENGNTIIVPGIDSILQNLASTLTTTK